MKTILAQYRENKDSLMVFILRNHWSKVSLRGFEFIRWMNNKAELQCFWNAVYWSITPPQPIAFKDVLHLILFLQPSHPFQSKMLRPIMEIEHGSLVDIESQFKKWLWKNKNKGGIKWICKHYFTDFYCFKYTRSTKQRKASNLLKFYAKEINR